MSNNGIPFKFNDIAKMKEKQINKDWKLRTKIATLVSQDLKDIMSRMLEPNTSLRITAAEIMAHPFVAKAKIEQK